MEKGLFGKAMAAALIAWSMAPAAYASPSYISEDASGVGFLDIREHGVNVRSTAEPYDMSGGTLGMIKLSPFQLQGASKQGTDDQVSASAQQIMTELGTVEEAHKKGDWNTALSVMRVLQENHPDLPFFSKWVAIYQNRNKDYKGSLSTIASLREAWPLDKEIQNSFLSDYYILDDIRGMGDHENADKMLSLMKEKAGKLGNARNRGTLDDEMKNKAVVDTLLAYQEFMLSFDATGEVSKDKLDKLWDMIPKGSRKSLDHFHGFDLSDLGYLYGVTYNRKDVLNAYVRQKEYSYDAGTILRIRNAKKIIYDEE